MFPPVSVCLHISPSSAWRLTWLDASNQFPAASQEASRHRCSQNQYIAMHSGKTFDVTTICPWFDGQLPWFSSVHYNADGCQMAGSTLRAIAGTVNVVFLGNAAYVSYVRRQQNYLFNRFRHRRPMADDLACHVSQQTTALCWRVWVCSVQTRLSE